MEPREFRFIQNLQTAFGNIRTTDGYYHTVIGVAVKLDPDHKVEELIPGADDPIGPPRPFIVIDASASPTYVHEPSGRLAGEWNFLVHMVHDSDPTDDNGKLRTYLRMAADVERAFAEVFNHNGEANDTRLIGRTMRLRESQEVWAIVAGQIRFTRNFGRPND